MTPSSKAGLVVVTLAASAYGGWWLRDLQAEAAAAQELRTATALQRLADDVAVRTERSMANIRIENRNIYNEVQRETRTNTVYRSCVLPPDGLRLANEARQRAGQSYRALPASAPAGE